MASKLSMGRTAVIAGTLALAALSGCKTSYSPGRLSSGQYDKLAEIADAQKKQQSGRPKNDTSILRYSGNTEEVLAKYGSAIPSVTGRLTLFAQEGSSKPARIYNINTSDSLNSEIPVISDLERTLGNPQTSSLTIGREDESIYQISDKSIKGIDVYGGSGNTKIEISRSRSFGNKLSAKDKYDVKITFNTPTSEQKMRTLDTVFLGEGAAETGIGFATAGPFGAAAGATMKTIDGLYAVIKGQRVPQGTSLQTRNTMITGLDQGSANTLQTLTRTHDLHANNAIVVQGQGYQAVVYASNIEGLMQTKDGLSFTVKRKDAAELERFILGVVKIGTGVAIARTNINGEDCDVKLGIGGGRDGGQGGTDPGNSGVGGGSSSSGGTGGAPGAQ